MVAKGLEQGRREYNDCRARLGLAPLPGVHTGLSRALTLVGTLPQLEYPRRWEPWLRVVGPLLWEPPGELRRAAARRRARRARGAVDRAGPGAPHAARGARRAGGRARARDRHVQRPRAGSAGLRAAERRPGAVALLLALDAGRRRGRHPRRPRHARARALVRLRARRLPGRRRHGRERGARRLGRARRPAAAPAARRRARCGSRCGARSATPRMRERARATAAWIAEHDGALAAAGELEAWAGRG